MSLLESAVETPLTIALAPIPLIFKVQPVVLAVLALKITDIPVLYPRKFERVIA